MPPDFHAVMTSLSTAATMAKGFLALKSEAERQQMVIDLQSKILEAQRIALEAHDMETALYYDYQNTLAELDKLKDQGAMLAKLVRRDRLYFAPDDLDPLCPRCVEVDRRCIHLVDPESVSTRPHNWVCPACDKSFGVALSPP